MDANTLGMLECDMRELLSRSLKHKGELADRVRHVAAFWIEEVAHQRSISNGSFDGEFPVPTDAKNKPLDVKGVSRGSKTGKIDSRS